MKKTGYREILLDYIAEKEPESPILTEQVVNYAARHIGRDDAAVRKAVNVNMARLEKTGHIIRVSKGVYCRKIPTAFGYYTPSRENLFCHHLLYDEDEVIGYETGLSALNRLGLVSQMPRQRHIATNRYTKKVPKDIQIEIRKPTITVNAANFRYLQMLDIIRDIDKAPVDTEKPADLLRKVAEDHGLNKDMLVLTARKHYNQKTLNRTIDIMLEERYENIVRLPLAASK